MRSTMRLKFFGFILICGLLSACSSAQFAPSQMTRTYEPRTPSGMIEIFRSTKPVKAYFEIGAVTACCSANSNTLVDQLRATAADKGGDALIDLDLNAAGGMTATVIRYK